ncbi:hypothetical protein M768_13970 [Cellulosimicrobium cellulans F16]|uniref:Uncharacterized protein n=1 Tax=Cellulosimicrobium cellulans F16 TaxID=1350482 RepID=A0A0M0F4V8_CELCE|nr:hypothetical protein [Cellulosimicrobium cellulans]KON72610.1 hypothetical protein M768_13970 [Cellulosimicrobium cellulans F16]
MTAADAGLPELGDVVTWPQAVVAVVVIFALVMWPNIVTMITSRRTARRLENVEAKTEVAAHEVRPNSGGSMADAVNRIEAGQKRTESKLDQHLTEASEHNARVDARLDRLERRGWLSRLLGL